MRINSEESLFYNNNLNSSGFFDEQKQENDILASERNRLDSFFFDCKQDNEKDELLYFGDQFEDELKPAQKSDSLINENTDDDIQADEEISSSIKAPEVFSEKEEVTVPTHESVEVNKKPASSGTISRRKTKSTEFSYLLERKAFRMMRKYYKEQFEFTVDCPDYKKRLPTMTSEEMDDLVYKFMDLELKILTSRLSQKDFERTRDALKTIILCERYKKKELVSSGLNFTVFRNVIHKYNTRNLIELLSDASYSFLFTHFFLKNGRKSSDEQEDVDTEKLVQRMRHLMKEASNYLPSELNALFEEIYASINY